MNNIEKELNINNQKIKIIIKLTQKKNIIDVTFIPPIDSLIDADKHGVLVRNNIISQNIIKGILLSDDELEKLNIGYTTGSYYRYQLIKSLICLWD